MLAQRVRDVLVDRERVEQRGPLDHEPHTTPERQELLFAQRLDVLTEDFDLALIRLDEAGDVPEQHGLPGAAPSHDHERLALERFERQALEDFEAVEPLPDVVDLDDRRHRLTVPRRR